MTPPNVKPWLVDLFGLFWLKHDLSDVERALLIDIGLGFDNLFSAMSNITKIHGFSKPSSFGNGETLKILLSRPP